MKIYTAALNNVVHSNQKPVHQYEYTPMPASVYRESYTSVPRGFVFIGIFIGAKKIISYYVQFITTEQGFTQG